jgi:glutathione S-transferase
MGVSFLCWLRAWPFPYDTEMLQVHHLNNSRSQQILWLLEELALPYEIVKYQRNPQTNLAPDELKSVHVL